MCLMSLILFLFPYISVALAGTNWQFLCYISPGVYIKQYMWLLMCLMYADVDTFDYIAFSPIVLNYMFDVAHFIHFFLLAVSFY